MRSVWLFLGSLSLVSAIGFAQLPGPTLPSEEARALGLMSIPTAGSSVSCTNLPGAPFLAAATTKEGATKAIVIVNCGSLGSIQCTIGSTSTWTAYERNCPLERGRLICDGVTYSCPKCQFDSCARCNETGNCQACCLCNPNSPQCLACGPP